MSEPEKPVCKNFKRELFLKVSKLIYFFPTKRKITLSIYNRPTTQSLETLLNSWAAQVVSFIYHRLLFCQFSSIFNDM